MILANAPTHGIDRPSSSMSLNLQFCDFLILFLFFCVAFQMNILIGKVIFSIQVISQLISHYQDQKFTKNMLSGVYEFALLHKLLIFYTNVEWKCKMKLNPILMQLILSITPSIHLQGKIYEKNPFNMLFAVIRISLTDVKFLLKYNLFIWFDYTHLH